jgi:hypothetical protein
LAGTNTIDIIVNSGSGGTGFLSPVIVYDAIDFLPTGSVPLSGPPGGANGTHPTAFGTDVPFISLPGGPFAFSPGCLFDHVLTDRSARQAPVPIQFQEASTSEPPISSGPEWPTSMALDSGSKSWTGWSAVDKWLDFPFDPDWLWRSELKSPEADST